VIGFTALAVWLLIATSIGALLRDLQVPDKWIQIVAFPVIILVLLGVGLLTRHLYEISWRCPACHLKFKFED
jgi:hypothetical protein